MGRFFRKLANLKMRGYLLAIYTGWVSQCQTWHGEL